jgi:predicted Fe-Mo cluster-binding NifX family protein
VKVAVAASDNEKFTEHFGKAQKFLIYRFNGENMEFLEKRESPKEAGEKHQWGKSSKVIEDCNTVICLQIGMKAKAGLKNLGKEVVEDEGTVEEVLERFVKHYQFMNKPLF